MTTQIEANAIIEKTKALCQSIVDHLGTTSHRRNIDTFLADADARGQYEAVVNKGQALQEKQAKGAPLDSAEIADFEKHRDALLNNPVARGFLAAREELHEIQHSIQKYVSKTLELGRVPGAEDLEDHACGDGGCGCHHH
ncbi:MAG TPA: YlbF family regulator [Candidatus Sulfopaludibacter sp.]|nr:YlbF family regulator [Candidatus Sulfopaludibacter sp.]